MLSCTIPPIQTHKLIEGNNYDAPFTCILQFDNHIFILMSYDPIKNENPTF